VEPIDFIDYSSSALSLLSVGGKRTRRTSFSLPERRTKATSRISSSYYYILRPWEAFVRDRLSWNRSISSMSCRSSASFSSLALATVVVDRCVVKPSISAQ
jgi:hypothetical protein